MGYIFLSMKSRRLQWNGLQAKMSEIKNEYRILVENYLENGHFEDLEER
jgi:hypothetical protein